MGNKAINAINISDYICEKLYSKGFTLHNYGIRKFRCIMVDYGRIGSIIIGDYINEQYSFMYNIVIGGKNYDFISEPNKPNRLFYSEKTIGMMLNHIHAYRKQKLSKNPIKYYEEVRDKKNAFIQNGQFNKVLYNNDISEAMLDFFVNKNTQTQDNVLDYDDDLMMYEYK